jgi:hypothetical protein
MSSKFKELKFSDRKDVRQTNMQKNKMILVLTLDFFPEQLSIPET